MSDQPPLEQTSHSIIKSQMLAVGFGTAIVFTIGLWLLFLTYYHQTNRIFPGVMVQDTQVGGLTQQAALDTLLATHGPQPSQEFSIILTNADNSISVASNSSQLAVSTNFRPALDRALVVGRARSGLANWIDIIKAWWQQPTFQPELQADNQKLEQLITELKTKIDVPGVEPQASLASSGAAGSLSIEPGKIGQEIPVQKTIGAIQQALTSHQTNQLESVLSDITVVASSEPTASELTEAEIAAAKQRATNLVGSSLAFRADGLKLTVDDTELISWLELPAGYASPRIRQTVETWTNQVNRPPQDAVLEYDPQTLEVATFQPDRPGLELDIDQTVELIKTRLIELETTQAQTQAEATTTQPLQLEASLPVAETAPATPLANTNTLGITEKIGFGESYYDHSIPSRIHNVALTTERISNHIVKPGEEFSFNQTLGEVSSRTGFKPAYVIKGGRTELGDGGGVCQVSTTLFRSVLDAGLEVTRRLPHSYRVSYYELDSKPGVDATVYSGDIDLRFRNDTNHHILISGQADSDNLYMYIEIYGTSDGRTTELVDHKTWGYRPPLPTQYFDDPSLPAGRLKQIDWAASGISASFTNVVKDADGNVIREDTYTSTYRPWAAKYLRGI